MHDVSDSSLLNQKLFQSELKLRQFFAAIPDLVVVISLHRSIEFLPTQINLSDPRNQLIIEATTNAFFYGEADSVWLDLARSVIVSQQVTSYEYSLALPDNTTDWFMASIAPFSDDEVVCIIRNITASKHHEIALAQAKEVAEKANRSKTIFLQNISHELRTPLNAMIGFTQILQEQEQISPVASKYLIYILNNSYYLLAMVNQLLDLARIESDVLHTTLNLCHTRSFVQEIMDQFLQESNKKNLDLILNIDDNVPQWIYIDALKVRQILQNLIHNAVKFTNEGSISLELNYQAEITPLQIQRISESQALLSDNDNLSTRSTSQFDLYNLHNIDLPEDCNAWLCVVITDTGVGILPEEKAIIWQPFSQGKAGKDSYQGVGLGLAIFHRFIKHLGAQIFFDSEVGVGTKFTVLLPVKIAHASFLYGQETVDLVNPYHNDGKCCKRGQSEAGQFGNEMVKSQDLIPEQLVVSTNSWTQDSAAIYKVHQPLDRTIEPTANAATNHLLAHTLLEIDVNELYLMQQLVLQADFNGLQDLCHSLEPRFPQAIAALSKMLEEFAYEELLNFVEAALNNLLK